MSATIVQAKDSKWAVVRPGELIPETGPYLTNAEAWEALDGRNPSRGGRAGGPGFSSGPSPDQSRSQGPRQRSV